MSSLQDTFKALLRASGQSVTASRLAVFAVLAGEEPLSMHQLVERARGVDRASVYRAVALFERLGIVQRLHTGWKYKIELTDKFAAHNHHLTCTHCGKTIAINEHELERFIDKLALQHQFAASAHQIEIQGLCQACQHSIERPRAN